MTVLQARVLEMLEERRGSFLSGEIMAEKLNVSRTAVMKAVKSIKDQGFVITSVRRMGYRLDGVPDVLDAEKIRKQLRDSGWDVTVEVFRSIDSTNNEGKKRAHDLNKPVLLVAEEQTMGRGRQGHSFYSPAKTGLYMSIVIPTALSLKTVALCTQLMAVAAVRAVDKLHGPYLRIKWVNDLYLDTKKTAGILTEAVTDLESQRVTAVVCGIGINLTTSEFPDDICRSAGALGQLERNGLAAEITGEFLKLTKELPDTSPWMDEYRQRSLVLGRPLSFTLNGQDYHAVGKEIDGQGRLVVELEKGSLLTLSSGEVSVIPE